MARRMNRPNSNSRPGDNLVERWSPEWEQNRFAGGSRVARYVWSDIVSLTFRYFLARRPHTSRDRIRVLELGCGTGANLLFFAKEGLQVAGTDGSQSAIRLARESLEKHGLAATLHVHDFADGLPFPDSSFDLVLDRASLTHNALSVVARTVGEAHRVLKPSGLLLIVDFFSTDHPGAADGREIETNTKTDFTHGMFEGIGKTHFTTEDELRSLLQGFTILHMEHKVYTCIIPDPKDGTAQYNVVAEKR